MSAIKRTHKLHKQWNIDSRSFIDVDPGWRTSLSPCDSDFTLTVLPTTSISRRKSTRVFSRFVGRLTLSTLLSSSLILGQTRRGDVPPFVLFSPRPRSPSRRPSYSCSLPHGEPNMPRRGEVFFLPLIGTFFVVAVLARRRPFAWRLALIFLVLHELL